MLPRFPEQKGTDAVRVAAALIEPERPHRLTAGFTVSSRIVHQLIDAFVPENHQSLLPQRFQQHRTNVPFSAVTLEDIAGLFRTMEQRSGVVLSGDGFRQLQRKSVYNADLHQKASDILLPMADDVRLEIIHENSFDVGFQSISVGRSLLNSAKKKIQRHDISLSCLQP